MLLFIGLGNPGADYAGHRHNVGFMAVDRIAADHGFSPWRSRFQGMVAEGRLGTEKVVLLKPATFMNLSGQAAGEAMRFFKLEPADVTVFHDELDLAPGRVRVKDGGGHAGHNGLRSLHQHVGDAYRRVRIGIGHPGHKDRVAGYVLHDFAKADAGWLEDVLHGISDGAPMLAAGDGARFMNAVALRIAPPRSGTGAAPPAAPKAVAAPAERVAGASSPEPGSRATPPAPASPEPSPAPAAEPEASPLRRLLDRFSRG
jgi:PTH1 family peptidyl-tRNA hydrolase